LTGSKRGSQPADFKPMPTIKPGADRNRVQDDSTIYCVTHTLVDAVVVLQTFEKKAQRTSKTDTEIAKLGSRI
jgi:phage-related protein